MEADDMDAIRHDLEQRPVNNAGGRATDEQIREVLRSHGIHKDRSGKVLIILWGSGKPRREFLHVDDLADAVLFLLEHLHASGLKRGVRGTDGHIEQVYSHINIGTGVDLTIRELAGMVKERVGFTGKIQFDYSKPDGTPRKLLDVSRLFSLGWKPFISLDAGIAQVYKDYLAG
jgi:GDP-L-fucose synthase